MERSEGKTLNPSKWSESVRYLYFIPHAAIGGRKGVPAREFFPFQGASLVTQNLIIIPLFVDGQKRYTDSSSWRSYNAQTDMTCFLDLSQDYLRGQSKTVKDMLRECISRLDSGQHHCSGLPVWCKGKWQVWLVKPSVTQNTYIMLAWGINRSYVRATFRLKTEINCILSLPSLCTFGLWGLRFYCLSLADLRITSGVVTCRRCALTPMKQLVYLYRSDIPTSDLPGTACSIICSFVGKYWRQFHWRIIKTHETVPYCGNRTPLGEESGHGISELRVSLLRGSTVLPQLVDWLAINNHQH